MNNTEELCYAIEANGFTCEAGPLANCVEWQALRERIEADNLAATLIDTWCKAHGTQIPWAKCIEIIAVAAKLTDDARNRLLNLD